MNININSFNNRRGKKGNKFFGYLTILLILVGAPLACIIYISVLKKDKTVTEWYPNVTDQEKITRTSDRGTVISIILMLSSLVQATLKGIGASSTSLLLLYGFFMASVIGFMGDQGYGTDDGFSLKEIGSFNDKKIKGIGAQLKYIFGTLTTASFWRFIITVFLDMFISAPIQSVIVAVFNPHLEVLKNTIPTLPKIFGGLLKFVTKNFDNVLQSFVAFITFLAYANDTRFRWAYAGSDIKPDLLISTSVIKISTAIAGIVYLIANISADFNVIEGATMKVGSSLVDRLDRKMFFVLIMIGLLTLGSLNENSFLNKKNNRYEIKPLVNMTDENIWYLEDTALNKYYNKEIEKLVLKETDQEKVTELQKEICNSKIGGWNTCDIDTKTGNLKLNPDKPNSHSSLKILNDYKQQIENENFIKVDASNTPITDEDGVYITETGTTENKIKLSEFIKTLDRDNNPPCFIPDEKFLCNCKDYLKNSESYNDFIELKCNKEEFKNNNSKNNTENHYLNENNGKLVKKIDMGLYRTHSSNIETKYDIIDKSNKGFGIFCLYIFIGVLVPFLPIKFIYGSELEKEGSWVKFTVISIVMFAIAFTLFFISKRSPSVEVLEENEKEILKTQI